LFNSKLSGYVVLRVIIGEGSARTLLAIGKLEERKGYASMMDLTSATLLSISSIEKILSRLERNKLIHRESIGKDVKVTLTEKGWNIYKLIIQNIGDAYSVDEIIELFDSKIMSINTLRIDVGPITIRVNPQINQLKLRNLFNVMDLQYFGKELLASILTLQTDLDLALSGGIISEGEYNSLSNKFFNDVLALAKSINLAMIPVIYMRPRNIAWLTSKLTTMYTWVATIGKVHRKRTRILLNVALEAKRFGFLEFKDLGIKTVINPRSNLNSLIEVAANAASKSIIRSSNKYQWFAAFIYHELSLNAPLRYDELFTPPSRSLLRIIKEIMDQDYTSLIESLVFSGRVSLTRMGKDIKVGRAIIRGLINLYRIRGENFLIPLSLGRVLLWKDINYEDPHQVAKVFIKRLEDVIGDRGVYGMILKTSMALGIATINEIYNHIKKTENMLIDRDRIRQYIKLLACQGALLLTGRELEIVVPIWLSNPLTSQSKSSLYKPVLDLLWHDFRKLDSLHIEALRKLSMRGVLEIPKITKKPKEGIKLAMFFSLLSPDIVEIDKERGIIKAKTTYAKEFLKILAAQRISMEYIKYIDIRKGRNPDLIINLLELGAKI